MVYCYGSEMTSLQTQFMNESEFWYLQAYRLNGSGSAPASRTRGENSVATCLMNARKSQSKLSESGQTRKNMQRTSVKD